MRILVADDESVSLHKMELIMRYFGQCDTVDHGQAAMDAFFKAWKDRHPYDLIMLDQVMPAMSGVEVLSRIREFEEVRKIPGDLRAKIIIVTGKSDLDTVVSCVNGGCDEFLVKPFDRQKVESRVYKIFPTLEHRIEAKVP